MYTRLDEYVSFPNEEQLFNWKTYKKGSQENCDYLIHDILRPTPPYSPCSFIKITGIIFFPKFLKNIQKE